MARLLARVPTKNEYLRSILVGHAGINNGYKALYSIIYCCSDLLDLYSSGFRPVWKSNQGPSAYVLELQAKLDTVKIKHSAEYTNVEISIEILSKAVRAGYKPMQSTSLQDAIKN